MRPTAGLDADVTIVGGGPAGSATALTLCQRGYSVVVIEKSAYDKQRLGEMLPPRVQPLLASLGVWDQFLAQQHIQSLGIRSAWGQAEWHEQNFIFNPYGSGWHLDRARFDWLLAEAAGQMGVRQWRRARLVGLVDRGTEGWDLTVQCAGTQFSFRTNFLVDATGRASALARRLGARRRVHDRLIGVARYFATHSSKALAAGYTLIEAIAGGWWYAAALPGAGAVAVLMTDADLYAEESRSSTSFWHDQLKQTAHMQTCLASDQPLTAFRVVAANSSRLDCSATGNWLAVGDAAAAFDPLSAQGVVSALKSGLRAAQAIHDHFAGRFQALEEYDRSVQAAFQRYLGSREFYYAKENRWPSSVFWHRRHAAV